MVEDSSRAEARPVSSEASPPASRSALDILRAIQEEFELELGDSFEDSGYSGKHASNFTTAVDGMMPEIRAALANTPDGWLEIDDDVKDGRRLLVTRFPYTGRQPYKVAWWSRNASKRPAWVWRSRTALRFEPTHYFDPAALPQPPEVK
ncbi:MAG: hypothetical protein VX529_08685 [Pseudomonadota bacterium]|nr:hypothetical protein [Pseudomonadota bacterium]